MIRWMLARMEQNPHAVFYEQEIGDRFPEAFTEAKRATLIRRVPTRLEGGLYALGLGRPLTVTNDGNRIDAFDEEDPESEPVELSLAELARWRLDLAALARQFQKANSLQGTPAPLNERLFFLGDVEQDGQRIAAVLALVSGTRSAELVLAALPGLCASSHERIIAVCPTFTPNPVMARQLETLGVATMTLRETDSLKLDLLSVQQPRKVGKSGSPDFRHSEDYRTVDWRHERYTFSPRQALAVEVLHKAFLNGTPFLSQSTVLARIGSDASRLRDIFRKSKARGTLIIPGEGRGVYGLNL